MQCGRTGQSKMRRHHWGRAKVLQKQDTVGWGANGRGDRFGISPVPPGGGQRTRAYPVAARFNPVRCRASV